MKNLQAMHVERLKWKPWVPVIVLSVALAALSSCGSEKGSYPAGPGTAKETLEANDGMAKAVGQQGNQSLTVNVEGIGGAVFLTGGGAFDRQSGFLTVGGAFHNTEDINTGPLAGCKAGEGARWDATAILPTSGFKCGGSASEPLKTAVTDDDTIVMQVDFYRKGDGANRSFTAKVFVSAVDEDPDQSGIQNVWIQGVGCGEAHVHLR